MSWIRRMGTVFRQRKLNAEIWPVIQTPPYPHALEPRSVTIILCRHDFEHLWWPWTRIEPARAAYFPEN